MEKKLIKTPDYVGRIIEERNNLVNKIDKLSNFTEKDSFNNLPIIKKQLLYSQLDIMKSYEEILRLRMQIETGQITSLEDKEATGSPAKIGNGNDDPSVNHLR